MHWRSTMATKKPACSGPRHARCLVAYSQRRTDRIQRDIQQGHLQMPPKSILPHCAYLLAQLRKANVGNCYDRSTFRPIQDVIAVERLGLWYQANDIPTMQMWFHTIPYPQIAMIRNTAIRTQLPMRSLRLLMAFCLPLFLKDPLPHHCIRVLDCAVANDDANEWEIPYVNVTID